MTSTKPYLVRAFYEWIVDNNLTPYVVVSAEGRNVQVPRQFIDDGKIVLNISPTAAHALQISNDWIEFDARFSGSAMHIVAPVTAVLAIYARENGRGIVFEQGDMQEIDSGIAGEGSMQQGPIPAAKPASGQKPKLTVVKGGAS